MIRTTHTAIHFVIALTALCCCQRTFGVDENEKPRISRVETRPIDAYTSIPLLSCYHADYYDSMLAISDIVAGVIHVFSLRSNDEAWSIEEDHQLTQAIVDQLGGSYFGRPVLSVVEVADAMGVSLSDLDADNLTRPHLSAGHFKRGSDTLVVSGQLRVHSIVKGNLESNIVPLVLAYDIKAKRRISATVIPVAGSSNSRLISESSFFITDTSCFIREEDRKVLDDGTGVVAPIFTSYSSDMRRTGRDIMAGKEVVSDFGYGLQQNLPTRLSNGMYAYTSAPTPALLIFDPRSAVVQTIDYSNVIRTVAPLCTSNKYSGEWMSRKPPNAFLCTGYQFAGDLACAVITDWNASAPDSIACHVVVARRDHLSSAMLFIAEKQPSYDSLQAVKAVTWVDGSERFLVIERHRASKEWYLSTYRYWR